MSLLGWRCTVFLIVIGTKMLRLFLHTIQSHLHHAVDFTPNPFSFLVSWSFSYYSLFIKPSIFMNCKNKGRETSSLRNLKIISRNPQRNRTFMNSISVFPFHSQLSFVSNNLINLDILLIRNIYEMSLFHQKKLVSRTVFFISLGRQSLAF